MPSEGNRKRCAYLHCTETVPETSYFTFPNDLERSKIWLRACNREDLLSKSLDVLHKNYGLCRKHFDDKCFSRGSSRKYLFYNAVPTIFSHTAQAVSKSPFLSETSPSDRIKNYIRSMTDQYVKSKKRKRKCCVKNCKNLSGSKVHRFPKREPTIFKQWLKLIQPPGYETLNVDQINNKYFVCGEHFKDSEKVHGTKRVLIRHAVPSLNIPEPSTCQDFQLMEVSDNNSSSELAIPEVDGFHVIHTEEVETSLPSCRGPASATVGTIEKQLTPTLNGQFSNSAPEKVERSLHSTSCRSSASTIVRTVEKQMDGEFSDLSPDTVETSLLTSCRSSTSTIARRVEKKLKSTSNGQFLNLAPEKVTSLRSSSCRSSASAVASRRVEKQLTLTSTSNGQFSNLAPEEVETSLPHASFRSSASTIASRRVEKQLTSTTNGQRSNLSTEKVETFLPYTSCRSSPNILARRFEKQLPSTSCSQFSKAPEEVTTFLPFTLCLLPSSLVGTVEKQLTSNSNGQFSNLAPVTVQNKFPTRRNGVLKKRKSLIKQFHASRVKRLPSTDHILFHNITRWFKKISALTRKVKDFKEKLKCAETFAASSKFKNLMKHVNEHTYQLILSQIENQPTGNRKFTLEDKILSLSLFKATGKAYKLLSKIFALPSSKTLTNVEQRIESLKDVKIEVVP